MVDIGEGRMVTKAQFQTREGEADNRRERERGEDDESAVTKSA